MTMRTSPTVQVPLSDLPDRQSLLRASRGSCNKNTTIGFIDKYSFSIQSQLYTSICTHIHTYSTLYKRIVIFIQACISFIPMSITIYPFAHLVNLYDTATFRHLHPREKNTSVYILYIYIYISCPANKLKYQTHLQIVLILV